jgi:hypothetical protein
MSVVSLMSGRNPNPQTCGIFTCVLIVFFVLSTSAGAAVPNPAVTGPVVVSGIPGNTAHDYPFFATNHDLATHGYIEEEFFIQGTASRYNTPAQATGTVIDGDHPYKTRVVVRRPADAKRFNGTVLVEWYNVTNGFDAENMWFFAWEHMLRAGYVWVGVSAQQVGVATLKKFSAARYGANRQARQRRGRTGPAIVRFRSSTVN